MKIDRFTFRCDGDELVGLLHQPDAPSRGILAVTGPLTSVKEQAPSAYARAMAERGFTALAFDHRSFGESGGQPRQLEFPSHKIADMRSAIDALIAATGDHRVFALGVCAGAGYMAHFVASDFRVLAFAGVAGVYHSRAALRALMGEEFGSGLKRAYSARERRLRDGEVEYIPAVASDGGDVAMPLREAFEFYGTSRGTVPNYTNKFAVESRMETLPFDAQCVAALIAQPTLMIHSEHALAPPWARDFFAALRAPKKELWLESRGQIDFYDSPHLIATAADAIAAHFAAVRTTS
jgi:fermentation-respiration switch protein FrsA (DUF1100 family)